MFNTRYLLDKRLKLCLKQNGFSLIELLLTVAILAFCLCGILLTYINLFLLTDLARDMTKATSALQAKMEEIKNTDFDSIPGLNGLTFELDGFNSSDAEGVIEVANTAYTDLLMVRLVASFRSRNRIIGEDQNLNGVLNEGEDSNANGRLDSVSELATLIAR